LAVARAAAIFYKNKIKTKLVLIEILKKEEIPYFKTNMWIFILFNFFYAWWAVYFIHPRADHYQFYLLLFSFFVLCKQTRKFVLGMSFFTIFWIMYDSLREIPNYTVNDVHIIEPYNLEKSIFGIWHNDQLLTPNEYFRKYSNTFWDVITSIFYLTWVPVPLILALILFFKNKHHLLEFSACYLFVNLLGFIIYYSYPSAPPWYYASYGTQVNYSIQTSAADLLRFDDLIQFPLFKSIYTKGSNVFAALPSLHSAYPVLAWYYAKKHNIGWFRWVIMVDIIGIWFGAVYSSHHYMIDVLAGLGIAIMAILIFEKILLKLFLSKTIERFAIYINGQ
jgi:inositol phosphorylceramide synthase catalytic subunit